MSASGLSTNPSPSDSLRPAKRADYRYLGLLGQGQFAQIYCAVYRRTGQLVAIKETRHVRQRASQEAWILQALTHPNIVSAQAIAQTKIGDRLVLEYCEAGTLRSHMPSTQNTSDRLPLTETQSLITDLLAGLAYLHQQGIAHGDLKPENLLLTWKKPQSKSKNNNVKSKLALKIGDFGNAVLLGQFDSQWGDPSESDRPAQNVTQREIGSPTYAAPERFHNLPAIASDLYAVGVIIYELLLGDRPFSGSPHALEKAHKTTPLSFPNGLLPPVEQFLTKALHKQPEKRFSSAAEMQRALVQLSAITAQPAATLSPLPTDIPETSLSQVVTKVSSYGITAPIDSLIHVPQGCCIVTAKSLHLVTPKRKLLSIARFKQPHWITVAPNGRWFAAVSRKDNAPAKEVLTQSNPTVRPTVQKRERYRFSQGMVGHLSNQSGHQWRRSITFKGRLLTELCASVLKVIALNNRYLLRVSTTQSKTCFECFTRRGQFVGELSVNFRLTQITRTAVPYQLIAIKAPEATENRNSATNTCKSNNVVLITLKPFRVRTLVLPVIAEQVSALPWGYLISAQRSALLLDRSTQITSLLTGLPTASKFATLNRRTLLLANSTLSSTISTPTQQSPIAYKSSEPLSLLIADTSALDLGLIF